MAKKQWTVIQNFHLQIIDNETRVEENITVTAGEIVTEAEYFEAGKSIQTVHANDLVAMGILELVEEEE
jgi:hypothetical protein